MLNMNKHQNTDNDQKVYKIRLMLAMTYLPDRIDSR